MKRPGFKWALGGKPPIMARHSNAKLDLLAHYLDNYFDTIVVSPAMDKVSITFVDGFSGGGRYLFEGTERPGSPFVLLEAVRRASERLNRNRIKPVEIVAHYYFVDKDVGAIEYLRNELIERGFEEGIHQGRIKLLHGKFEDHFATIVEDIKRRQTAGRSIFVLDQKGWNAVQFTTIRRILHELKRSEVLLTFAVDWLVTHLHDSDQFSKAMGKINIEGERLQRYVAARGEEGYEYIVPRLLLQDIRDLTGAPYYTPFFLRSKEAHRNLWIVHLSKITTARNVMVQSHWDIGNNSLHRGNAGLDMLGFDPYWEDSLPLDFDFDQRAGERLSAALMDGLPGKIKHIGETPSIAQFMHHIANGTAATKDQIEVTLSKLYAENQIDILNQTGNRKKLGSKLQVKDRVRLAEQKIIPGLKLT